MCDKRLSVVSSFSASNTGSGDISLTNGNALDIAAVGITNNVGNLNTARTNALAAGIDQINCIGIGPGANCAPVIAGTGSFGLNATTFGEFETALRRKIFVEVRGVPEPGTWMMMIFGFGLAGTALRRQRRNGITQLA